MEALSAGTVSAPLSAFAGAGHGYLAAVAAGELAQVSDADVLAELREVEALRRRLAVVDHALVGELDRRGLAGRLVTGSTAALLQGLLRLSPFEAKERVTAARACGTRASLTGEPLPPALPILAAAQADGSVSTEHTKVIVTTLDRLPASAGYEDQRLAEKHLVEAAMTLRPREVTAVGRRILAHLDPDGSVASEAEQHRRRSFTLQPEADGSYTARGRLTRPVARCSSPASRHAQRRSRPMLPGRIRATMPSGCMTRSRSWPVSWYGATNCPNPVHRPR